MASINISNISNDYKTCNGNLNNDFPNKILFFSDLRVAQDLNEKTFVFIIKYNNFILGASQNFLVAKNWVESYTSQITSALTLSNKYSKIEMEDEDSNGENYCFRRNIFGISRANFVNLTSSLIDTIEIQKVPLL